MQEIILKIQSYNLITFYDSSRIILSTFMRYFYEIFYEIFFIKYDIINFPLILLPNTAEYQI